MLTGVRSRHGVERTTARVPGQEPTLGHGSPLVDMCALDPYGAHMSTETASALATLRFAASGVEVIDDGRPILEQAEGAGLRPTHGCRRGICHTCTRPLQSGTVRNLRTGELTADVGAPIRLCVNAPVGEVVVDL